MAAQNPVTRLNADLRNLANATAAQHRAEHGYNVDSGAEQKALAEIAKEKQAILDAFQAAPDAATQQKLAEQMFALGQKDVRTVDAFDQKLQGDKRQIGADAAAARGWVKKGRADLLPAEYRMGLPETNRDRKALGLAPVKKAIRPPKAAPRNQVYVVQAGDTMTGIAGRFGVSLSALERANPQVRDPNLIQIGERLNVPGGRPVSPVSPSGPVVGGTVGQWISQAQRILAANGVPYGLMNAADLNIIIQHESSGNPNAENRWDINWQEGHPSIGLMQTIGPTFNAYKLPGHGDIWNPVDNIIAGTRYAIARYGSVSNVPGVVAVKRGEAYVGY